MAIENFISTVWSENLLKNLDAKYVGVANCNREFEGDINGKGSSVKICGIGDITVSDYTKNEDMDDPEELSEVLSTLYIDHAKYFNFQIDDIDKAQMNPKIMDAAMSRAASALAAVADEYIFGMYEDAYMDIEGENVDEDNILDYFLKARTVMMRSNVTNPADIIFEVSPDVAAVISKAKIVYATDNTDALEAGLLGTVLGSKVYVSNNIRMVNGFHKCYVRTKRAIAFAEQISEVEAYRPEKRFADAVKGLHLYGAQIVYPQEFNVLSLKLV